MYFQLQAQLDKKDANGIRSENVDEKTEDETEQDNGYRGASYAAVLVSLPHSLPSESTEGSGGVTSSLMSGAYQRCRWLLYCLLSVV